MIWRPDILVLGGGGRQGDAWTTGVLAGLEDAHDMHFRECEYFVGTSAGAIVAAKLASGRLRHPSTSPAGANPAGATYGRQAPLPDWAVNSAMALGAPFAQLGLRLGRTPGEVLRSAVLPVIADATAEAPDFRAAFPPESVRFDGRLRVVAVERRSGKRVVFGAPGAPQVTVAQALRASCALPMVFAPAMIAGHEYVDGATWSPSNADVAPAARDAQVLLLNPMASFYGPFHAGVRALARAAMLLEASALKERGAQVRIITPDRTSSVSIGRDLMSEAGLSKTLDGGYRQGLAG
ncbi:MAG: patatin-like phospholipase family protein [Solirubrobacteraceae bacterium]